MQLSQIIVFRTCKVKHKFPFYINNVQKVDKILFLNISCFV